MLVCGIDEVGRGALAGPIFAAGVTFSVPILNLKDSKKLSPLQRKNLFKIITSSNVDYILESISVEEINKFGIGWANKELFIRIARKIKADKYIADGNLKILGIESVIKADNQIPEVMAASIIAKIQRDEYMTQLHEQYTVYDWKTNKGYGTKKHIEALKTHGSCEHHRKLFIRTALKII